MQWSHTQLTLRTNVCASKKNSLQTHVHVGFCDREQRSAIYTCMQDLRSGCDLSWVDGAYKGKVIAEVESTIARTIEMVKRTDDVKRLVISRHQLNPQRCLGQTAQYVDKPRRFSPPQASDKAAKSALATNTRATWPPVRLHKPKMH